MLKINNGNIKKKIKTYFFKNQKSQCDFFIFFLKVMLNNIHQKITKMLDLYNFKLQLRKKHI